MELQSNETESVASHLFNPAFVATLLWEAVYSYNDLGMDYPIAYVILPFVLHRRVRHDLPPTKRLSLAMWLQQHPDHTAIFPELAQVMRPYTSNGILWATNTGSIDISPELRLRSLQKPPARPAIDDTIAEVSHCLSKAAFLGKWLAAAGSTSTIYAMLGVRP